MDCNYVSLTPKMALQLAAPHTWVASVCPVLFGILFSFLSGYDLGVFKCICLLSSCILMQSSANTLNDYVDFVKGTDSEDDNVEVSDATLVYNNINPKHALVLGIMYLLLGALFGIIACLQAGLIPVYIGLFGAFIVLLYSGGPLPISSLPLGEVVSGFVMGGLIPLGIMATADGNLHLEILIYSIPFIIGIGLIMMSNNGCDIEKDILSDRFTLPGILGRKRAVKVYHSLVIIWLVSIVCLAYSKIGFLFMIIPVIWLAANKPFKFLLYSKLLPKERVLQMKNIVLANMVANGAYMFAILMKLILER